MSENFEREEYYLRLTGKANIPSPLSLGDNYDIHIKGTITGKTESDKFDGTKIISYKLEPVQMEAIDSLGKSIKGKDMRSLSQIFRSRLWAKWSKTPTGEDFDTFYGRIYEHMIQDVDDVILMFKGDYGN